MQKTEKGILNQSIGINGGKLVTDTSETAPASGYDTFFAIQVLSDCVISADSNIATMINQPLTAGTIVYGLFNSFTLTSGSVIAYHST